MAEQVMRTVPRAAGPGEWTAARLDRALRIVDLDDAFAGLFGVSELELRHRGWAGFLASEVRQEVCDELAELARTGHGDRAGDATILRPDGLGLSISWTALAAPDGSQARVVLALAATERSGRRIPRRPIALARSDVQLLEGLAAGVSTMPLARSLGLSRQGLEYRVGIMLRRFGVANRLALIAKAYSLGVFAAASWPARVSEEFVECESLLSQGG